MGDARRALEGPSLDISLDIATPGHFSAHETRADDARYVHISRHPDTVTATRIRQKTYCDPCKLSAA
jgi:hypothetical protein